ncbi:MAG: hypothetical protein K1X94_17865 [Sandaracinaceae bacterium]|nr:hypothetical protein [Sandaracinaceae bacterium]
MSARTTPVPALRCAGVVASGLSIALVALGCEGPRADDVGVSRRDAGPDAAFAFPDALSLDAASPPDAREPGDVGLAYLDASRAFAFDLDGDGTNDADLALLDGAGEALLHVETMGVGWDVPLGPGTHVPRAGVTFVGPSIQVIGEHVGGRRHEVAALVAIDRGDHDSPALVVVDLDAVRVLGTASAPAALTRFESYDLATYAGALEEGARSAPFLAPGYGDAPAAAWGYACVFRVGASSTRCGEGFVEIDTSAAGNWFREVGGLTSDLDGDGTGDLTLVYHQRLRSYSGTTGGLLADTEYDVALADEPGSPRWFHSGRNYGTFSFVHSADGLDRTLIVGGAPVGSFADYNCNVSRFVAVLASTHDVPSTRHLAWSDYFGFASSIFRTYSDAYASDPAADLARLGDFTNGCIHRFSDSRVVVSGEDAVMFDYFVASGPVDTCLDEQYALYLPPTWTPEKVAAWNACISQIVGQTGTWGMQVRRLSDGASVTGSLNTYVWGATDRLLPSGELVYVVESMPSGARFDVADVAPSALHVWALVDGLWSARGDLPIAGRPRVVSVAAEGDVGVGSFSMPTALELTDVDGDGLAELGLAGGERVGWDGRAFVVR